MGQVHRTLAGTPWGRWPWSWTVNCAGWPPAGEAQRPSWPCSPQSRREMVVKSRRPRPGTRVFGRRFAQSSAALLGRSPCRRAGSDRHPVQLGDHSERAVGQCGIRANGHVDSHPDVVQATRRHEAIALDVDSRHELVVLQPREEGLSRGCGVLAIPYLIGMGGRAQAIEKRLQPVVDVAAMYEVPRWLWTEKQDVKLGCELQAVMDQRGIDVLPASTSRRRTSTDWPLLSVRGNSQPGRSFRGGCDQSSASWGCKWSLIVCLSETLPSRAGGSRPS